MESAMGAWGSGYFENDGALDALAELSGEPTFDRIMQIFEGSKAPYIETDIAEAIVATAAIVTGESGGARNARASQIYAALGVLPASVKKSAIEALQGVLTRSETAELWANAAPADRQAWMFGIDELIMKLKV
jgi:hypothetical protein